MSKNIYKSIKYREKSLKFFVEVSKAKEKQQQEFIKNIQIFNNKSGEFYNLTYSLEKNMNKIYHNITQRSIDLQSYCVDDLKFKGCAFITLTLDTHYQKYTTNNTKNKHRKNPLYEGYSINEGYQKLQDTFRNFYKQCNRDKIDIKNLKTIEPHKSFTPHLHALVYYNSKEDFNNIKKILSNKIYNKKEKKIRKTDGYIKYKLKGSNGVGKVEIEEIQDLKRGAAYLLKYLKKNFNDGVENMYMLDGWKKINKIRLVTSSNNIVPNYVYTKLLHNLPKEVKESNDMSSLTWCRKNINIFIKKTTIENDITNITGIRKLRNNNTKFDVFVEKEYITKDSNVKEEIVSLINRLEDDSYLVKHKKKILEKLIRLQKLVWEFDYSSSLLEILDNYIKEFRLLCKKNYVEIIEQNKKYDEIKNILEDFIKEFIIKTTKITRMMIFDNTKNIFVYDTNDFESLYEFYDDVIPLN